MKITIDFSCQRTAFNIDILTECRDNVGEKHLSSKSEKAMIGLDSFSILRPFWFKKNHFISVVTFLVPSVLIINIQGRVAIRYILWAVRLLNADVSRFFAFLTFFKPCLVGLFIIFFRQVPLGESKDYGPIILKKATFPQKRFPNIFSNMNNDWNSEWIWNYSKETFLSALSLVNLNYQR